MEPLRDVLGRNELGHHEQPVASRPQVQCAKCPWRKSTNPHDIPNGYCETKHRALSGTIADPHDVLAHLGQPLRVMACHETHQSPCVGWLANQLGPGNNLSLRLAVSQGRLSANFRLVGEQHESFDQTLPKRRPR